MKNIIAAIAAVFVFASCNQTATQFKEKVAGSDSLAINYYDSGGKMDSVVAVKITSKPEKIEILTNYIVQNKTSINNNCGIDGSIHYFKNDKVVQDVFFCSSKDCRQFIFSLNGEKYSTKLSDEAKNLLEGQGSK